jgi:hypothetical protein
MGFACDANEARKTLPENVVRMCHTSHPGGIGRALEMAGICQVVLGPCPEWDQPSMNDKVARFRLRHVLRANPELWDEIIINSCLDNNDNTDAHSSALALLDSFLHDDWLWGELMKYGWVCYGIQPMSPEQFAKSVGDVTGDIAAAEKQIRYNGVPWFLH